MADRENSTVLGELASALEEVLGPALGPATIHNLVRLTAGANRETWAFDADATGERHRLILQRDRAGVERLLGACAREADVLRCAGQHGVPVAEVVVSGDVPNPLVRSFTINRRIEGETIARRILRDDEWASARASFVEDCAQAMAKIHHINADALNHVELEVIEDALTPLFATYAALDDPQPAFDLGFRWLDQHRPDPLPTCLVHGDFRLGNLILDHDGLAAALDWEITHLGDPGEDLGWICVRAWRFGGSRPVGGIGDYEHFLQAYERASGLAVSFETLRWWEIYGTLRWGVICLQLGGDFRAGRTASVEMATIGRRAVENAHDLMELLP
jgi:aminoglycoside phosphotransferase (APT) family kinase protein